ncbi:MAG: hypothetical protein QOC63_3785 [Mycobacterium sp.]|jgi:hypothetical protein|nr:hypothetical protein [Mycobacterium sp.]
MHLPCDAAATPGEDYVRLGMTDAQTLFRQLCLIGWCDGDAGNETAVPSGTAARRVR